MTPMPYAIEFVKLNTQAYRSTVYLAIYVKVVLWEMLKY